MVTTASNYLNGLMMNIGVQQYDPRIPIFPGLDHWMASSSGLQTTVKEEPRDEPMPEEMSYELTPPRTVTPTYTKDATPTRDTPPTSTPSPPANREGSSSNSEGEYYEGGDSLKRLQMALHRTGMISEEKLQCPVCDFSCSVRAQFNEHLTTHETKCSMCEFNGDTSEKLKEHMKSVHDCEDETMWGDEELSTPKVNSQGKVKTFRCKQCEFSAVTKLEFWDHSRTHIKQERLLTCPKCPFVTEYKHHLEYHLRNHFGSKPFKCDQCSYSCVNKSMLNSHLKSHSNIYQFRCADCTYATKYCHSLKLHLRKYNHSPAMVLNPDGSPNPFPIVDVYGTRRGPKQKPKHDQLRQSPPHPSQQIQQQQQIQHQQQIQQQQLHQQQQQHLQQNLQQQKQQPRPTGNIQIPSVFNPFTLLPTQMPYYNILNGFTSFPFSRDMKLPERNNNIEKSPEIKEDKAPLDLSRPDPPTLDDNNSQETPVKNRRKGKAFKLDTMVLSLQEHTDTEDEAPQETPEINVEPSKSPEIKSCEADSEQKPDKNEESDVYNCTFCDILFKDIVMYTMHMGYHGYQDPFKCNMCGQQTSDKVSFFLHIARTPHS